MLPPYWNWLDHHCIGFPVPGWIDCVEWLVFAAFPPYCSQGDVVSLASAPDALVDTVSAKSARMESEARIVDHLTQERECGMRIMPARNCVQF